MTNKICFVIQPFSETYKNRYKSVYERAIENAGLTPYRTGGHSVDDIPEDIRRRIREAHICFADITEDRPNVWYEVGFAHACDKQVVMVCDEEVRTSENLPFDISVRNVLFYKGKEVDSDRFYRNGFIKDITDRTKARSDEADTGSNAPVATQQPQNSDNILTETDGKVLKIIYAHYLKYNHPIVRRGVTAKFFSIEEDNVLISLNRMEHAKFIVRREVGNILSGIESEYLPTEKGQQWVRDNSRD